MLQFPLSKPKSPLVGCWPANGHFEVVRETRSVLCLSDCIVGLY